MTIFNWQSNRRQAAGKRRGVGVALTLMVLLFAGCAAELDRSQSYEWAFVDGASSGGASGGQGGSSGAQGGSTGAPVDPACLAMIFSSKCTSCHSAALAATVGANLDLGSPNIGQRLLNKASNCTANPVIINGADPNNSTFLKKVTNQATGCNGGAMPPASQGLTGTDLDCVKNWILSFKP